MRITKIATEAEAPFLEYDPFVGADLVVSYRPEGDMSGTAVVRIYSGDGFVIAADGLRRDGAGTEKSRNQQKIFAAEGADSTLAYAATGMTYVDQGSGGFDVSSEVSRLVHRVLTKKYDSPGRFTEEFAKALRRSLREAQNDQRIKEFLDFGREGLIVSVLFAGYYSGRPFVSRAALSQDQQRIQVPKVQSEDLALSSIRLEISGSEKVKDLLWYTDDPRLSAYRTDACRKVRNKQPFALAEGVELAKNYIAACSDPVSLGIDPDCAAIGGRIHVATIKPCEGFRWVEPPIAGMEASCKTKLPTY